MSVLPSDLARPHLATSAAYSAMDEETEKNLQAIIDLATYICKCSAAYISIFDDVRSTFQTRANNHVYCSWTENTFLTRITRPEEVIEGIAPSSENIFQQLGLTNHRQEHWYAGTALMSPEGKWIGALWVTDTTGKNLDQQQKSGLVLLASKVITHLEIAKKNQALNLALLQAQKFTELFNQSNEIHCITDREARIEYINDSIFHLLGYSPQEALGKTIWDFCVPNERERVMPAIYAELSKGQDRFQVETRLRTKNGELRWFEWSDVMKNDRWLINGRDITDRKKSEMEARILSTAVEKSAAGVFIRNASHEIIWMNKAAEDLMGYSFDDLKNKTFGTLFFGKDTDQSVVDYAVQRIEANQPYTIEIQYYKKDGTPIWLYVSTTPLFDESGQVERIISVAFDITARMRVEEQLVRTREDALNLSRAKESFLSVMSHEMRTPLNAVIGMSRLLAEEEHLKQQEEHLGILQFSAENLLTLINDLLDYTKIETGNMVLESAPVNLDSLASKTIQSLMPKAREQGITLAYEVDPHVPAFIYADHTRLYQILINLLGNAVKFTSKGFVKLKIAEVGEEDEKALIRFEVTDTGIGIAADKLTTIFDPYKQAGSDITRKFGGTGLGLAITKKLIELYGSEISVSSKLNEGTTFSFTLELKKARLSDIKTASKTVEESLSGHILVVDDSAVNRLVAQKILKRWKLDVDVAEDGVEALEKIERNDYDLVLMDIHMPVMDGLEAVKAIRSRTESKYRRLPIIALTGSIVANEDATIKDAGMNDYVLKPFDPPFLYSKIKALLPKQEETAIN